jgi:hypothetical protein
VIREPTCGRLGPTMSSADAFTIQDLTGDREFSPEVITGQAVYTEEFLRFRYEFLTHLVTAHLAWDCPARNLVRHYQRHASADHLDVGVGSGNLLARFRLPSATPRIALMDLNEHALRRAAGRIRHYPDITLYRANVLDPIPLERRFESIGATYLLHCLPGRMEDKGSAALGHLAALLAPGGVLFGATLINDTYMRTHLRGRKMAAKLRSMGVFDNEHDTRAGLEHALGAHFDDFSVDEIGCVALFHARSASR